MLELTRESLEPDQPNGRGSLLIDRDALHVLVADQDDRWRDDVRSLLVAAGMRVTEAADGAEALAAAADGDPDVAMISWPMPAGGLPLAQQLIGRRGMIGRVIMLSEAYDRRDHLAALRAGARYVVKSHAPERLVATVRAAVGSPARRSGT